MSRSVLVVDDDGRLRLTVAKMIRNFGYEVHTAPGGREAIAMFENGAHFDGIFTDLWMPECRGEEVLSVARRFLPDAKLVLMTGDDLSATQKIVIRAAGADEILQKPFGLDALSALLERLFPQN